MARLANRHVVSEIYVEESKIRAARTFSNKQLTEAPILKPELVISNALSYALSVRIAKSLCSLGT